ncbi:MAG: ribosomal-processing cysteine protease Prp [Clostridia bacterium]|nr:ribosomal-processing cysteine protease Prp [Clostridia bacterium]
MVKASFCIREDSASFTVKGHSGFAEAGEDIVCAAVSSAAYMAVNTVTEILGEKGSVKVKDGYLQFKVSGNNAARDIIRGLLLHLEELSKDYPDYVTVTTEV